MAGKYKFNVNSNPGCFVLRLFFMLFVHIAFNGIEAIYASDVKVKYEPVNVERSTFTGAHAFLSSSESAVAKSLPPVITLTGLPNLSRMALLSWVSSNPILPGTYFVERQAAPATAWDLLTQLPYNSVLQYNDTISYPYCTTTNFLYRIRFQSAPPGNDAISDTSSIVLWDQTSPANVQDVRVSITSGILGSFPEITWSRNTGDDISGYRINRYNGFSWDSITTVSADSSHFIDKTVADGCDKFYQYIIFSVDKCGHRSAPDYSLFVQTLHLAMPAIDKCERLAKLSWNPYLIMPGGLGGYKVYRMLDYGTPVLVIDISDTTINQYSDAYTFLNGHSYTYFVQAYNVSGTGVSSSCKQTWTYTGADVPDSVYITKVSVVADAYIQVSYHSSPAGTVKKMILERSLDGGSTFQAIDSLVASTGFLQADFYIDDRTADIQSQSYDYRLVAIDDCGTKRLNSNVSRSIFLQCSASPAQNNAVWNTYGSWIQGVEGYKIFRTVEGLPLDGEMLANNPPVTVSYTDLLAGVSPSKEVCYWIVARENPGNPYLNMAESVSNTCCIIKGATMYLPNAFRPESNVTTNTRFRPLASFVDPASFRMIIFSRWGQQIFETSDMVNGWDGNAYGQAVTAGLYCYVISYKSIGGQDYTKKGTVMVVR